jgi:PAS domain S-box-containing protein
LSPLDVALTTLLALAIVLLVLERTRVARQARREQLRTENLVKDQTEFLARWDTAGLRTFVNTAYSRFLGRTEQELLGHSFFEPLADEDRERVHAAVEKLTTDEPCRIVEHRVNLPDGGHAWNGWSLRGIFDADGALTEVQAVGRDITDRKRAEEALRLSEERYRSLYTKTPVMLHSTDRDLGKLLSVSDHWLAALGLRREEVLGRPFVDFLNEESKQRFESEILPEFRRSGLLVEAPVQYRKSDGGGLDALLSTLAERGGAGEERCFAVSIDVTERNRVEGQKQKAFEEIARLKDELERERDYLREEVNVSLHFGEIIGRSNALQQVLARIEAVAGTDSTVLILGESGVGKELVARAIYARSQRAGKPLVKVNCASIPHELFESEFFGHIRGSFTGAHRDRIGRFQLAHRGTLFLDEVAEIPLELQGKLLRVLQEGEFERVGEDITRKVDVRLIAATNRDLRKEAAAGRFREDLYYRLSVLPIEVPPLRRRREDILPLATHFLELVCRELGKPPLAVSRYQAEQLERYDWPGNVRELRNVMERAAIFSPGDKLRLDEALPGAGADGTESEAIPAAGPGGEATTVPGADRVLTNDELRELQRRNLIAALDSTGWRVSGKGGAAELLGLKPSTLTYQIKSLGIQRPS